MPYSWKRFIWIVLCLLAILSEMRVAQSGEFLWLVLNDTWRIVVTVAHIIFVFLGVSFAIYYNTKDINQ